MRFLGRYAETLYALMRIVVGFLYLCHGGQKLFGWFGAERAAGTLMTLAGLIEFGGGLLILLGLFVPIVAFIASGEMAVAYFHVHAKLSFFPIVNHGELAVAYCFVFLYMAAHGSGLLSLDSLIRRTPAATRTT
jgi:putative oxidoreductase